MAEDAGDKKHEATPYRRQKAREEGQQARSQDLGSALVLLGAIGTLMTWGPDVFKFLAGIMVRSFTAAEDWSSSTDRAVSWVAACFWGCIWVLIPIFMASAAVAWLASWIQIGFLFLPGKV